MAATAAMSIMAMSSLASAYTQSQAAKTQGEFQKQQAEQNARLAEMQAKETEAAGEKQAAQHRAKVKALVGSQKAALAAQGIDIGAGTALDLIGQTTEAGEDDAATIRMNAYKQAFGIRQEAQMGVNQGQFDYLSGRNEARNTLLTGGLQALSYGMEAKIRYDTYKAGKTNTTTKTNKPSLMLSPTPTPKKKGR